MTQLTKGTWVLIADGEKALFLRNDLDEMNPDLNVVRMEHQENPPNHEQADNRRGRVHESVGAGRSAYEDTDWHELAKERFADELAEILYDLAHRNVFERIVLVAPPRVLGELREKMHKEVSDRVVAELHKTLTNHPLDKVETMLRDELAGR